MHLKHMHDCYNNVELSFTLIFCLALLRSESEFCHFNRRVDRYELVVQANGESDVLLLSGNRTP